MFDESQKLILSKRLWREVMDRNRFSPLMHLVISALAIFIAREMYTINPWGMTYFAVMVICSYLKNLILIKLCKEIKPSGYLEIAHNLCLVTIGLFWGLFWVDVEQHYGRTSVQSVFALMTISAFITGAVNTQSPKPIGYLLFSFFMAVIPVTVFFWKLNADLLTMALGITLYMVFNLIQLKFSHSMIKKLFENDMLISNEREKLLSFINAVPGFVFLIDRDLSYQQINETAKIYFDMAKCEGVSVLDGNPECQFPPYVKKFMESSLNSQISEVEMISVYGPKMVLLSIQKAQSHLGGAVIVAIPIDELVKSREIIKLQEAKNFHTAKLVSLGETAAGIAHEINNPLAIILGFSDQILRILRQPEPDLRRIEVTTEKIQTTVERISGIIKSLRILSRNGEKDPYSLVSINSLLNHASQLSKQRFQESGVKLEIQIEEKIIKCMGQEVQLLQVIMNLLINAFDAASEGPEPRWVKISTETCKDHIILKVQDSGPGVPADLQEKIMEPFFTTKPINKGTGLGLSISKSIIENHDGRFYLDGTENQTTFIVRLKAAP